MKKIVNSVITIILLLVFTINVNAAECSYEEQVKLNDIAATLKATYEEIDYETGEMSYYVDPETGIIDTDRLEKETTKGFKVSLLNITDQIQVEVTNETTGETNTYNASNTDNGTVILTARPADMIYNYKFVIRARGGDCTGTELRIMNLVVPKYNEYSDTSACTDYPNYQYCQKYLTTDLDIDFLTFYSGLDKYKETNPIKEETKTEETKLSLSERIKEFINKNKTVLIIIGSVVVIAGVATTAIIVVRRRSRLI